MFIAVILGNCLAAGLVFGGIAELWFRFNSVRPDSAEAFMHNVMSSAVYLAIAAIILLLVQIATFLEKLYLERKESATGVKTEKSAPSAPFKKKEQKPASASGEFFRAEPVVVPVPEPAPAPQPEAAESVSESAMKEEKQEGEVQKPEEKAPVKSESSLNFFRID